MKTAQQLALEQAKETAYGLYSTYMSAMNELAAMPPGEELTQRLKMTGHRTKEAYLVHMVQYATKRIELVWRAHEHAFPD